jgi:hypothetical protein
MPSPRPAEHRNPLIVFEIDPKVIEGEITANGLTRQDLWDFAAGILRTAVDTALLARDLPRSRAAKDLAETDFPNAELINDAAAKAGTKLGVIAAPERSPKTIESIQRAVSFGYLSLQWQVLRPAFDDLDLPYETSNPPTFDQCTPAFYLPPPREQIVLSDILTALRLPDISSQPPHPTENY